MSINLRQSKGIAVVPVLVQILVFVAGALLCLALLDEIGSSDFRGPLRFTAAVFGFFLVPLWAHYKELKDTRNLAGLTVREQREVDHLAAIGERTLLLRASFMIFSGAFVLTSQFWPKEAICDQILASVSGGGFLLSCYFIVNLIGNMRELSRFEARISSRHKKESNAAALLAQMQAGKQVD